MTIEMYRHHKDEEGHFFHFGTSDYDEQPRVYRQLKNMGLGYVDDRMPEGREFSMSAGIYEHDPELSVVIIRKLLDNDIASLIKLAFGGA